MAKPLKKQVLLQAQSGNITGLREVMSKGSMHWANCLSPTGDTPLHIAAQCNRENVIRLLLDEWTNNKNYVDIASNSGKTALHEAAQFANPSAVSLLLERGANPRALKQADWTPLMLACTKTGNAAFKCCQLIYQAAGPSALTDLNKDGWTALHLAAREGDLDIIEWLLNLQPNLCTKQSKNGRTPLHSAALHGHAKVVALLLKLPNVNPNFPDSCGSTAVHDAVRSGSAETLDILISRGGDVKLTNALGQSVVHMAAETGDDNILKYIIEKCNLEADSGTFTCTPLHCAIRAGKAKAVSTLLQHNADPRAQDSCGYSCLDIAKSSKCAITLDLINEALLREKSKT